jgi:hypothetical protein
MTFRLTEISTSVHFEYKMHYRNVRQTERLYPYISICRNQSKNDQFHFIKKNRTRCNGVSKFYYSIFIWSSTCFGRHTAHHQEPKTALAASGFSYVEGCWTCNWWTLSDTVSYNVHQLHVQQPSTYENPVAASAVLGSWWWAVCLQKHVGLHINME